MLVELLQMDGGAGATVLSRQEESSHLCTECLLCGSVVLRMSRQ